jgi:hypothetical protein
MSIIQATQRVGRIAAFALALSAFGPAAHSQQQPPPVATSPAALATAKQLVAATNSAVIFNPLIAGVVEQAKLLYLQQDPGLAKDLNEIADQMRRDLAPRFTELGDEVALLYAQHFTDDELKNILNFYQSPTGKKLLQEQPIVVDNSMKFAQDWANKLSDQVIAKFRDELKKRGHPM